MTKKKVLGLALGLLAAVVLVAAVAVYRNRQTIRLIYETAQTSQEEIEQKIEDNKNRIEEAIQGNGDLTVRDLTDEEKEQLRNGELSVDELIEKMTGTQPQAERETGESAQTAADPETAVPGGQQSSASPLGEKAEAVKPEVTKPAETKPSENKAGQEGAAEETDSADEAYQKELSGMVAKAMILRETFQNELDQMVSSAKAEYNALPAEQRTKANLASIGKRYYSSALALEAKCDGEMNTLTSDMRALIEANNGDVSLADTMLQTYQNEKELKKSWYLSKLSEHGVL